MARDNEVALLALGGLAVGAVLLVPAPPILLAPDDTGSLWGTVTGWGSWLNQWNPIAEPRNWYAVLLRRPRVFGIGAEWFGPPRKLTKSEAGAWVLDAVEARWEESATAELWKLEGGAWRRAA